jgi:hypothetical protein
MECCVTITIRKLKQLHLQGGLASVHKTLLPIASLLVGPSEGIKVSITGGIQEHNKGVIGKGVNFITVSYLLGGLSSTANYHRHFEMQLFFSLPLLIGSINIQI